MVCRVCDTQKKLKKIGTHCAHVACHLKPDLKPYGALALRNFGTTRLKLKILIQYV